jgi:glucosamine--fructose-6-phosphate aminotransferase (isomerizing)
LVIMALSQGDGYLQRQFLKDVKAKHATVVTFSSWEKDPIYADFSVNIPAQKFNAAHGLPFLFLPQAIALYKALEMGMDLEERPGLDAWVKLDT